MTEETTSAPQSRKRAAAVQDNGMMGAVYGMGFIGALIYFLQHADSFWAGVWGVIQAIFWPAVMVYRLLHFLM